MSDTFNIDSLQYTFQDNADEPELDLSLSQKGDDPLNLITFNMNDSMPLQFSLSSAPLSYSPSSSSSSEIKEVKTYQSLKGKPSMLKSKEEMEPIGPSYHERSSAIEGSPFVCHYCDASFRMRGYLTRHIKKHAIEKAYKCPFYKKDAPPELKCHNSGGFSRRDTYKTHLKARHILYPKGVKPQERNKSSGSCSQCGEFFENTENFVELHIETGDCTGLPIGYIRNVKSERKSGKLRMIKTSNGHSRFISTAQSVIEPNILLNNDAIEAMAMVATKAQKNDILSTFENDKLIMNSDSFTQPNTIYKKVNTYQRSSLTSLIVSKPSPKSKKEVHFPLDTEQSPSNLGSLQSNIQKKGGNFHIYEEEDEEDEEDIDEEEYSDDGEDFDLKQLYEKDFNETKQYANLYNFTFGVGR